MLDGDFTSISIILMVLYLLAAPAALDSSDTRCATKGCPHLCPTQSYYCFLNGPLSFGSLGDKSLLEQDQFPFFDTRIQCGPHFSTMSDSFGNSKYWKILVMIHFSKEILKKLSSWGWTKVLLSCHLCQPPRACRMSSDTRYPAAHVSLPLAPPTAATGHSIQTVITPALFKRSRPLQPSLASSAHLRAAPQCSKQQHQVTFIWIIVHLIVDYFCDLGNYKLCWEMINEQK